MRITYEELIKRMPWLTDEQKEKLRVQFEKMKEDEKNPSGSKEWNFKWAGALSDLKEKYTSVELQKEALRLWSGI